MSTLVMQSEVKEWGHSLAIRITKAIKDALNLHNGSKINMSIDGERLIIESIKNPFFDLSKNLKLEDFTNKITEDNKPDSSEFESTPIGKEVW